MPSPLLLILTIPFAVVFLTAGLWMPLLYWLRRWRVERRFQTLAAALGATKEGDHLVVPTFEHGTVVRLHGPSRSLPYVLEVAIPARGLQLEEPVILLRREGTLDRLGKHLGLNREVQIGDALFDRAVYIETDAPDGAVRGLLGDPERRVAVLEILGAGFSELRVHNGLSLLSASRPRPGAVDFQAERVRMIAQRLALLAPAIPLAAPEGGKQAPLRRGSAGWVVRIVAGLVAIFGGPELLNGLRDAYPTMTSDLYDVAVPVAIVLYVATVARVGRAVRGHSDSLRTFVLLALALLLALPCYTVAAFVGINGALDGSATVRHASRIVEQSVTRGKYATCRLRFAGLRRGEESVVIKLEEASCDRFARGDAITVSTRAGALGWEWIAEVEPARRR